MSGRGVQVRRWPASAFWLLCVAAASASGERCLRSYNTSRGFSLHPDNLQDGAELLDARPVNSSAACLSRCCASRRCDLALVYKGLPGRTNCLLLDCTVGRKSVCTLVSSPGFEANFKSHDALGTATPPGALNNLVPEAIKGELSLKDCSRHCSADEFRCDDGCCVPFTLMCIESAHCFNKFDLHHCNAIRASYTLLTASGRKSEQNNERCTAPSKVGPCRAAFPRWYFDPVTQSCHEFIYGGCKGNQNNYKNEQQCLTSCVGQKEVITKPRALKLSDIDDEASCFAPAVTGHCRAAFPRWYYVPASQTCQRFTYGGCGGNKNNYDSESACLARCSGKTGIWDDGERGITHDKQRQAAFHHRLSVIVMVGLLVVCILILLGGVIYFIIKLAKADHVVSFHRGRSGEDKETLIHPA